MSPNFVSESSNNRRQTALTQTIPGRHIDDKPLLDPGGVVYWHMYASSGLDKLAEFMIYDHKNPGRPWEKVPLKIHTHARVEANLALC